MRTATTVLSLLLVACGGGGGGPAGPVEPTRRPGDAPEAPPGEVGERPSEPLGAAPARVDLPAPAPLARGRLAADGAPFGGARPGFLWWVSGNGRFVALYRFDRTPQFGHHGEVFGAQIELVVVDRQTGAEERYDDLVAVDAMSRHAILQSGSHLHVLDSATGDRRDLAALGADVERDQNDCLPPRMASIDPDGRTVAFMRRNPDRAVLLDLAANTEREVPVGRGRIWRAEATGMPGHVVIRRIPADSDGDGQLSLPIQNTSCACRWCNRFAASYGFYGWSGDAFESVLLGPGLELAVDDVVIPLGGGAVAYPERNAIERGGSPVALPAGCREPHFVEGVDRVLVTLCSGASRLFRASDGASVELPAAVTPGAGVHVDASGHHVVAVLVTGTPQRVGRLRLEDGRLEVGPEATAVYPPSADGWALARTPDGIAALHLGDGRLRATALPGVASAVGTIVTLDGDRRVVVDPDGGRIADLPAGPRSVMPAAGCAVLPASTDDRGLDQGPWQMHCPAGG